ACGQGRGGIGYQPYSRFWDAGPTRFGSGTTPTFSTLPFKFRHSPIKDMIESTFGNFGEDKLKESKNS
ncbi:hypothetical protein, partial [Collinsella sp. HCP3S3_E5]|uniref:hypothetical protein n=1 Tax=Collinsella sp. HCP3S3_E5 TaxID=3438936 RepID=UPI003F88770C